MRPAPKEKLEGIARVLTDAVDPCVDDPYAKDVLKGAADALRALAATLDGIDPFLRWDCAQAESVLALLAPEEVNTRSSSDGLEGVDLGVHHRRIRLQLEDSVPDLIADERAHQALLDYFKERVTRWPVPAGR